MLLKDSLNIAKRFGIDNEQIIIDPSVGFFRANGKNPFFTLMKDIPWYIRDIEVISRLQELKNTSLTQFVFQFQENHLSESYLIWKQKNA